MIVGCGPEKNPTVKSTMFQSVSTQEAILVQNGDEKKFCSRCGMNLVTFYKSSHSSNISGKNFQYCSIHCLVDHLRDGVSVDDPKVVDIKSLKFIDIREAYYVVGSNKRGTMSMVSKYAFSNKSDAQGFKDKNGGEIMDFYKAMEVAKKDFKR